MKELIIVCAGEYGREALVVANAINHRAEMEGREKPYNILGFLDDNEQALEGTGIQVPVIGRISDWHPRGKEYYFIGASVPGTKEKLSTLLKGRGCCFETLIAPWSIVSEDCKMGEGCFITAYSISAGTRLGSFVNVNGSIISPGAVIDDYSTTTGFTVVEAAYVGKRVFVGSHAVVISGVHVGDDVKISAGSIVTQDIPTGATVFGVPAQEI